MDHSKSFLDFSSCNTKKFQVNSLNVFTTDLNTSKVSFGTQILRRVSHIIPIGHWDITNLLFTSNLNCSIKLILKSYNLILLYIYNCQAQVQVPGNFQVQGQVQVQSQVRSRKVQRPGPGLNIKFGLPPTTPTHHHH